MSLNKLKREKNHKSILAQFFLLLVGLGLLCGALFAVLHTAIGSALENYLLSSDFLETAIEKRVNNLQDYVTENQVSATDSQALSQWMRGKPLTLMEIYRSNVLVYSSYASYSLSVEGDDFTWTATEGEEVPTYDWISYYTVDFADGEGEVVLYSNDLYRYSTYATIAEVLLCSVLFLVGFLVAFQRTVSYMRQISLEIQAMEGGDLNQPVTVRGDNDLTALAESLDAMRLAFRAQLERESNTYAANQALISQMSHDLRTPLTTLLIYTEILRYGKYQGEDQLRGYLDKIDEKAQQIKQLAENLLEYSLASQNRAVEMEPPAPAAGIFQPLLQEMATFLEQYGYTFQWDLAFGEGKVSVHTPYLWRILDNLSSNILKYASLREPIFLQAREQEGALVFSFRNGLKEQEEPTEGTCVGLSSVEAMMEKMGGSSHAEQAGKTFQITLVFPLAGQEIV